MQEESLFTLPWSPYLQLMSIKDENERKFEVIIEDYMKSKDNLMDMLKAYVSHRENIEKLLKQI